MKTRLAFIVFVSALALAGCGSSSPVGGWSAGGLYVCFNADGTFVSDDQPGNLATPTGTWTKDGKFQEPGASGTWKVDGDQLQLTLDPPCSSDPASDTYCGPYVFSPNTTLPCKT